MAACNRDTIKLLLHESGVPGSNWTGIRAACTAKRAKCRNQSPPKTLMPLVPGNPRPRRESYWNAGTEAFQAREFGKASRIRGKGQIQ